MVKKPETPDDFDVTKIFADFKVPGVDVDAMLASQRKNIEALASANRLAFEGVQAVMRRQMEIMRQSIEEVVGATKAMTEAGSPQEKAAAQTELVKDAFERTLSNMRELVEMMGKSNNEAFDLLNKRFAQTMDEVKDVIKGKK
ncbi:MAG: phasin family protein [Alphaproteobacteria bacterium]|nr:phasin family protein [Alphaproteobacteria bacterium]CAA6604626.1 Magnetic particle membrane specific GTPase P16 [Rhodospirillaceae bacterium LM-1]